MHDEGKYILLHIRYISITKYNMFKICCSNGYVYTGRLAIRMLLKTRMLLHVRRKNFCCKQVVSFHDHIIFLFRLEWLVLLVYYFLFATSLLSRPQKQHKVLMHAVRVPEVIPWVGWMPLNYLLLSNSFHMFPCFVSVFSYGNFYFF